MRLTRLLTLTLLLPGLAAAQQPLSAIDWLDMQNAVPTAQPRAVETEEPPVTDTAVTPGVEVTPLGEVRADAVGLLPTATTGLPRSLWSASSLSQLRGLLARLDAHPLPAMQALIYTLLLAEADPPATSGGDAQFLRARVHALVGYGAVDPARALLERAGPDEPLLFDNWLNLTLLSGDEDQPCALLRRDPEISADFGARVYCTARAGDWDTAALTYDTALALGGLQSPAAELLAQYLDPELIESAPLPNAPKTPTPLVFRLYEAAGAPLPTRNLPVAFAMADLRGTSGWKAELEAVERLARTGAMPSTRLLGIYTERQPAASGGIWDRVAAIQAFDKAVFRRAPDDVAETLPGAWEAMSSQGMQVPFAQLYAEKLMELELTGKAASLAHDVALLSPDYELAANRYEARTPRERLLNGIARGEPSETDARSEMERAIVAGFASADMPEDIRALLEEGKLGEAILHAILLMERGSIGSGRDVTSAIAILRAVGLEDTARRAALQLLLLEETS